MAIQTKHGRYPRNPGTDGNADVTVLHGAGVKPVAVHVQDIEGSPWGPRIYSVESVTPVEFRVRVATAPDNGGDYQCRVNGGAHPDFYWTVFYEDDSA